MHPSFRQLRWRIPKREESSDMRRGMALALILAVLGAAGLSLPLTVGTASAGTRVSGVHAATAPPVVNGLVYTTNTRMLSANGTSASGVTCPSGTLPVGGGTAVQNPQTEHVAQAGFVASAATGKLDGYGASVQVSSLPHGARVRFAVQVACVSSATTFVIYAVHVQVLSAHGTSSWGVACPVGTGPAGGGTAVEDPLTEHVTQAGFIVSATTGKADGYEATVQVSGLARDTRVELAVQAACIKAATAAVYGPSTLARSASALRS